MHPLSLVNPATRWSHQDCGNGARMLLVRLPKQLVFCRLGRAVSFGIASHVADSSLVVRCLFTIVLSALENLPFSHYVCFSPQSISLLRCVSVTFQNQEERGTNCRGLMRGRKSISNGRLEPWAVQLKRLQRCIAGIQTSLKRLVRRSCRSSSRPLVWLRWVSS